MASPRTVGGCKQVTYNLPDGGSIVHIMAAEGSGIRELADRLFVEFQEGKVPLQRCKMSYHRGWFFVTPDPNIDRCLDDPGLSQ